MAEFEFLLSIYKQKCIISDVAATVLDYDGRWSRGDLYYHNKYVLTHIMISSRELLTIVAFFNSSGIQFLLLFLSMWKIEFKKLVIAASVLLLQPMVSPGSFALAKKRPPKAYSFWAEGGKASQGECDGERKVPRKMKHLKEFAKAGSYLGSEPQTFEIKGKDDKEMWKHFFSAKSTCNAVLAKTPSSVDDKLKNAKQELPEDDSADSEDDDQTDDQTESPQEAPKVSVSPVPSPTPAASASPSPAAPAK